MLIVYIIQTIYKRKGRRPEGTERRLEEKKKIKRGKIWNLGSYSDDLSFSRVRGPHIPSATSS